MEKKIKPPNSVLQEVQRNLVEFKGSIEPGLVVEFSDRNSAEKFYQAALAVTLTAKMKLMEWDDTPKTKGR